MAGVSSAGNVAQSSRPSRVWRAQLSLYLGSFDTASVPASNRARTAGRVCASSDRRCVEHAAELPLARLRVETIARKLTARKEVSDHARYLANEGDVPARSLGAVTFTLESMILPPILVSSALVVHAGVRALSATGRDSASYTTSNTNSRRARRVDWTAAP